MTYTFFSDSGHGWLKVSRKELEDLGIADKISAYSYELGDNVYLEEDCDAGLWFEAKGLDSWKDAESKGYKLKESYSDNSKIRSYESYVYQSKEDKENITDLRNRMLAFRNWNRASKLRINRAGLHTLKFWQEEYGF